MKRYVMYVLFAGIVLFLLGCGAHGRKDGFSREQLAEGAFFEKDTSAKLGDYEVTAFDDWFAIHRKDSPFWIESDGWHDEGVMEVALQRPVGSIRDEVLLLVSEPFSSVIQMLIGSRISNVTDTSFCDDITALALRIANILKAGDKLRTGTVDSLYTAMYEYWHNLQPSQPFYLVWGDTARVQYSDDSSVVLQFGRQSRLVIDALRGDVQIVSLRNENGSVHIPLTGGYMTVRRTWRADEEELSRVDGQYKLSISSRAFAILQEWETNRHRALMMARKFSVELARML